MNVTLRIHFMVPDITPMLIASELMILIRLKTIKHIQTMTTSVNSFYRLNNTNFYPKKVYSGF